MFLDDPAMTAPSASRKNSGKQTRCFLKTNKNRYLDFGANLLSIYLREASTTRTSSPPFFCLPGHFKTFNQVNSNSSAAAAAAPPAPHRSHFSKQLECFGGPWVIRRWSWLWMLPLGNGVIGKVEELAGGCGGGGIGGVGEVSEGMEGWREEGDSL